MNQNFVLANRSQNLTLLPLRLALKEAKKYAPPDIRSRASGEEQLVLNLIENMKRQYRRPSPFSTGMGQPFPHEYKEMVAADVR